VIRFHLKQILKGTGGTLISNAEGDQLFTDISIDSRTITPGQIFFAIRGPDHDGHDYLREAWKGGCTLAVVDRDMPADGNKLPPIPLVVVEDTVSALQSLASTWRDGHSVPLLAVVGSVGKTTTKEMIAEILSIDGPCLKNPGNLNNHIGLPLSLLKLSDFHKHVVLELGANTPGEISTLTSISSPQAAVITRLGWAHLEGFGDPESLVMEKGAVLDHLPASGWCALNTGDEKFGVLKKRAGCRVIAYGVAEGDVTASEISLGSETTFVIQTPSGKERVHLRAFGRHFVENALAAVAVTIPLGLALEQIIGGLDMWRPQEGRGGILSPRPGVHFIDDTYNANPLSVETALENLAALKQEGVTVAVLGEMMELGDYHREGHALVGRRTAELGIDYLLAVGPTAEFMRKGAVGAGMSPERIVLCSDDETAADALDDLLAPGVWVLFKGSRAARIEGILERYFDEPASAPAGGH
jgi:UDP-N-acetylmuramoyl-tripeptide--D-alanyl-D-alanine ligase